ncbi:MAG: MFS transporter [Ilumatobacteraceae bacterium]
MTESLDALDTTDGPGPTAGRPADGIGALVRQPVFRRVMIANVLAAIALGTSRFVFVWLIGELTDWNPATAILGIVIGLPPLLLSAWAGSLADRLDPRRLGAGLFLVAAVVFTVPAVLITTDSMTVPLALMLGFASAVAPSMLTPLLQALVPRVVPSDRLMQGVALQNLGMTASIIAGVFLGGAVIQVFGTAAGFWLMTAAAVLGAMVHGGTALPPVANPSGRHGAIRDGARIALRTEPLRSLLGLTAVFGLVIAASSLLLPELARDVLGSGSLAASALNVFMSVGMVATSMTLATRWTPRRPGLALAITTGSALGTGLIVIGLSGTYALTAVLCLAWGMSGGIAMTLLRTLIQTNTPDELMGRVMGLSAMAQNGAFPVGAVALFGLVSIASVATSMVVAGVLCTLLAWSIVLRPLVRRL